MKKILIVILAVSLLGINFAANNGRRVIALHPVAFMSAVEEDLPPGLDIFKNFSDFYADGNNSTIGDKIFWLGKTSLDALSFPVTGSVWCFQAIAAFWGNVDVLFEFANGSGGGEHGDLDDPNHAGGR